MTSVECHLWQDLESPRKHASMCIREKLSMLDHFWACPWRMTLIRLVEVGRSAYGEWHHSLGWLLDCITRRKWVKHRHSLLSSSDTDRAWPHASSSCCLHFPTLTMGQNKLLHHSKSNTARTAHTGLFYMGTSRLLRIVRLFPLATLSYAPMQVYLFHYKQQM